MENAHGTGGNRVPTHAHPAARWESLNDNAVSSYLLYYIIDVYQLIAGRFSGQIKLGFSEVLKLV